ncbi:Carboxylesterase family-domain-containing protein [Diaporthe sp. PMI_573]|nr:Carboxylesterase family-domain-containing protein [Diaporthaceae sp. PMI_573]
MNGCLGVTSQPPSQHGRPVMFWIYGGSFQLGSASAAEYDGSLMAQNQDVVVVTFNYRTNVFGFPASPDIPINERNLGFMDQRKALAWVTENIRAFGGDPSKVTIFGESVGGYSVKQMLINPPQPLPFRAAIIQSQAFGPVGDGDKSWTTLVDELGCNKTCASQHHDCVKAAPAEVIRNIIDRKGLNFTPVHPSKRLLIRGQLQMYQSSSDRMLMKAPS